MSKMNIEKRVIGVFEEILELESGMVELEQTFEEREIDSILFIRLVVQCETEFNIQFEDEMLLMTKFPNVSTFVEYVQSRYDVTGDEEAD